MKTVNASEKAIALCSVKSRKTEDLTQQETSDLMAWCDAQSSDLWDGMKLQEILNVYRVSADYISWEAWAIEDCRAAYKAWNKAIVDPGNKLISRD